ncbi:MAG: hypothetical protein R3C60_14115 [Parvularculaceae bacterium]
MAETPVRFSCKGEDVAPMLDQACKVFCYPKTIRVDQSSKFISKDLDLWRIKTMSSLTPPGLGSLWVPGSRVTNRCKKR